MATSRFGALTVALAVAACDHEPLAVDAVQPAIGSVEGGTRLTITGAGFDAETQVSIAGIQCGMVRVDSSTRLSCVTGSSGFVEGAMDVVVRRDGEQAMLPGAFAYECPWTTSSGRRTCGAAPPRGLGEAPIAAMLSELQDGHGFVANPDGAGSSNLADTEDFTLGTRSAFIETDGAGTARTLSRYGVPAIDMRDHVIKVWLKVDNIAAAAAIDVRLGTSNLASYFRFRLRSQQGQQWITDGDWVAVTVSWSPDNVTVVGTPDRSAITDISFRVVDDAAGAPVRLHVNGIALVAEPVDRYPRGVVSFTFDDNYADMSSVGARVLEQHGYAATAYVIVDLVDRPNRSTLAELHDLQAKGWDIAAHAFTSVHHEARFPTLPAPVLEDDLVDSRAWLMSNRFAGFDHCAYPGGDFSNGGVNVLPVIGQYFTSCRTIFEGQREVPPPADPLKLRVFYVTSACTLEEAKAAVDSAEANREWLIIVLHKLVDGTPVLLTEWPIASYTALVDHVAQKQLPVETVARVLAP